MLPMLTLSMGDRIQDYHIGKEIGRGGCASVYLAKSVNTGQEVAIKKISKERMKEKKMEKRVKCEVEIHSQLKEHPSIVKLYKVIEDDAYVYLVLELCTIGDLENYSKTTRLNEDEVRHYMKQVVEGLQYLHSHGIMHRDLSLANLLLASERTVKISDFGMAVIPDKPDEQHNTLCGTPNYVAPEVAEREQHTLEADVWSVGCVLYTLLVRKPPFQENSVTATLDRVKHAKFDLPPTLSENAKNLIQLLLQKNPQKRIPLNKILLHPFMVAGQPSDDVPSYRESTIDSGCDTMATISTGPSIASMQSGSQKMKMPSRSSQKSGPMKVFAPNQRQCDDKPYVVAVNSQPWHSDPKKPANSRPRPNADIMNAVQHNRGSGHERPPASPPVKLRDSEKRAKNWMRKQQDSGHWHDTSDTTTRNTHPASPNAKLPSKQPLKHHNQSLGSFQRGAGLSSEKIAYNAHTYQSGSSLNGHQSHGHQSHGHHSVSHTSSQLEYVTRQLEADFCAARDDRTTNSSSPASTVSSDPQFNFTIGLKDSCDSSMSSGIGGVTNACLMGTGESVSHHKHRLAGNHGDSLDVSLENETGVTPMGTYRQPERSNDSQKQVGEISTSLQAADITKQNNNGLTTMATPLKSARLRPHRQKTGNAVVNILDDSTVCIEFFKCKEGKERVVQVFRISPDGSSIQVYSPNGKRGCTIGDTPPSPPSYHDVKPYTYENLPQKYWKRYQYAARFVKLMRSKTPKVTLYTRRAKCVLMESSDVFEVVFYDGAKITQTNDGTRIIESDGTLLTVGSEEALQHLAPQSQELCRSAHEFRRMVHDLENLIENVDSFNSEPTFFPVTLGRRKSSTSSPTSNKCSTPGNPINSKPVQYSSPQDEPVNTKMHSFDGSILSQANSTGYKPTTGLRAIKPTLPTPTPLYTIPHTPEHSTHRASQTPHRESSGRSRGGSSLVSGSSLQRSEVGSQASSNTSAAVNDLVLCEVYEPDVGWGYQLKTGEFVVNYLDRTRITMKHNPMLITYTDNKGQCHKFQETDKPSDAVQKKIDLLDRIITKLQDKNARISDDQPIKRR